MVASRSRITRPVRGRVPLTARFSRARITYWLAVLVLAAGTGLVVHALLDGAAGARAAYGETTMVLVARSALAPGTPLDDRRVERREWPTALLPAGALTESPARDVATAPIAAGEVVVRSRVSTNGRSGAAGLLPRGARALAVPVAVAGLPVRVGDRVDVLAVFDATAVEAPPEAGDDGSNLVATDATVIVVAEEAVTVAVDADEAPAVARALGIGTVVLALR